MKNHDLDLMLFDFEAEFAADPEQALRRLHLLALDGRACRGRGTLLAALGDTGRPRDAGLTVALRLVCDVGLLRAWRDGAIGSDECRALHRLSCDPDALLEAHRRLVGPSANDDATHGP